MFRSRHAASDDYTFLALQNGLEFHKFNIVVILYDGELTENYVNIITRTYNNFTVNSNFRDIFVPNVAVLQGVHVYNE